ncbi:MAG TPA: tetratricopeptide repeat protein [Acidobacteriaceae bacterium]|nr:tetratricopeptide repeat protein [Acidobacteriaceae bacterium]
MAIGRFAARLAKLLLFTTALGAASVAAQTIPGGRVVLVLPFENRSGNATLSWIGDSFPDTLDRRLNSVGFLTISHDDRVFALTHLGLPADFRPSRATTIRIAQQLDANYVVVGSYTVQPAAAAKPGSSQSPASTGNRIAIQAQVLSIDELRLSPPAEDGAELNRLYDAENAIAWKIARIIDPKLNVAEQTFLSAGGAVPLPAFENYIRGINAPTPAESLQRLQTAVAAAPNYDAALLALGKEQYTRRDFAAAASTLAKVPTSDPQALEANFYLGLARFNSANYAGAAAAFEFVASRLPLPEVVNDQGVALARQGKDAVALFQRASAADPSDEDYHYNLAIALYRQGDTAQALQQADAALKLKPNDQEAGSLRAHLAVAPVGSRLTTSDSGFSPVERVRRSYSEAGFRQAAFQLDQVRAARLAALPPDKRAAEYTDLGLGYLAQGLLPRAEQQFQSALSADPRSAAAHAGLAQVRERSGNASAARSEAQQSLNIHPNASALLVLARLDLAQNQLPASADDVSRALRLEPANSAALAMRQSLQQRGQAVAP